MHDPSHAWLMKESDNQTFYVMLNCDEPTMKKLLFELVKKLKEQKLCVTSIIIKFNKN